MKKPEKFDWGLAEFMEGEEAQKGAAFLLGFVVAFAFLSALIALVPLEFFEMGVAGAVASLLSLGGAHPEIIFQEPVLILLRGEQIQISYLCTGLLEMLVLVSAVVASFGIARRERLLGAFGAVAVTFAFNQARIIATIHAVFGMGPEIGEIFHEFFFRAFLFLVIVGYYALWFFWATRKKDAGAMA